MASETVTDKGTWDLSRAALTTDGNIHSQNMIRALLWLIERRLEEGGFRNDAIALAGADIAERLRDDLKLIDWNRRG